MSQLPIKLFTQRGGKRSPIFELDGELNIDLRTQQHKEHYHCPIHRYSVLTIQTTPLNAVIYDGSIAPHLSFVHIVSHSLLSYSYVTKTVRHCLHTVCFCNSVFRNCVFNDCFLLSRWCVSLCTLFIILLVQMPKFSGFKQLIRRETNK